VLREGGDVTARESVRPTLEVVAARAGVSRATASRVLRGATNVSEQARAAVLAAAEAIAYSPNLAARALVTRRTDSIAFLVAESEDRLFGDPYFLTMLRGAQAETARAGLQLIFAVASSEGEADQFERYAAGGHVDGVLLLSLHGNDRLPHHLESIGVATVLNGRPFSDDETLYYVDSDNLGGGRAATQVLIDRGAKCIATITGPLDMVAGLDRLAGYHEAMRAARRKPLKRHVVTGDFSIEGGIAAMNQLLDSEPALDAVFAASDLTAVGAIHAATARGLRVPDDIAIIGFDDIPQAAVATPALTTVRQPIDDLGRSMARILMQRLAGEPAPRTTVLPVQVVRRASA
jgi:DNA-binding LacI/PurR family transcriptional regulator